jgi:hypothetical protein
MPFVPHAPRLSHTHDSRAVLFRRPRRNKVRPSFRLPAKSIARFFDFTEQPGSLHFAHRRQLG